MADIPTNSAFTTARPQHHIHDTSDPLPGTKGGATAVDYSADTLENTNLPPSAVALEKESAPEQGHWTGSPAAREDFRNNGFDSQTTPFTDRYERAGEGVGAEPPMHAQPQTHGGVSVGDNHADNLPEGKAKLGDKIVGKTQKVMGKVANKPELQEKGEIRETAGKAAVKGEATRS